MHENKPTEELESDFECAFMDLICVSGMNPLEKYHFRDDGEGDIDGGPELLSLAEIAEITLWKAAFDAEYDTFMAAAGARELYDPEAQRPRKPEPTEL